MGRIAPIRCLRIPLMLRAEPDPVCFGVQFWRCAILVSYRSGLKQIDFSAAVHLTSVELEASNLTLISPGCTDLISPTIPR
jgi:hypothetical protein